MEKKEQFYAELKGVYSYFYEWKESIERNKKSYSEEDYKFQLEVLQSLRAQLKYFGKKTWLEIEKTIIPENGDTVETEEETKTRVQKIITFKNYVNKYLDDYNDVYNAYKNEVDEEEKEELLREVGFYLDAVKSNNYKFEEILADEKRDKLKEAVKVLDQTHTMSFDPFKIDHNQHIILKTKEELEEERDIIIGMSDSAFDRFDKAKQEGIILLLNKLYDLYINDSVVAEELERDFLVRKNSMN